MTSIIPQYPYNVSLVPVHTTGTATDDLDLVTHLPSVCVDYLSHYWTEEDVYSSWKAMTRHKAEIANGIRLENASWRMWARQRQHLPTISPEKLNWFKDSDVTWLYGPLHTPTSGVPEPRTASASERLGLENPSDHALSSKGITRVSSPSTAGAAPETNATEHEKCVSVTSPRESEVLVSGALANEANAQLASKAVPATAALPTIPQTVRRWGAEGTASGSSASCSTQSNGSQDSVSTGGNSGESSVLMGTTPRAPTAASFPPRPASVTSASIASSSSSGSNHPVPGPHRAAKPTKSILKHRSLSDLLLPHINVSEYSPQDSPLYEREELDFISASMMAHNHSETQLAKLKKPSVSPDRLNDINSAENATSPPSSVASAGRKRISFNTRVDQCIAVDGYDRYDSDRRALRSELAPSEYVDEDYHFHGGFGEEFPDADDDEVLSFRPGLHRRRSSRTTETPSGPYASIARLGPTTLKDDNRPPPGVFFESDDGEHVFEVPASYYAESDAWTPHLRPSGGSRTNIHADSSSDSSTESLDDLSAQFNAVVHVEHSDSDDDSNDNAMVEDVAADHPLRGILKNARFGDAGPAADNPTTTTTPTTTNTNTRPPNGTSDASYSSALGSGVAPVSIPVGRANAAAVSYSRHTRGRSTSRGSPSSLDRTGSAEKRASSVSSSLASSASSSYSPTGQTHAATKLARKASVIAMDSDSDESA